MTTYWMLWTSWLNRMRTFIGSCLLRRSRLPAWRPLTAVALFEE
jgi:hypothetical protein